MSLQASPSSPFLFSSASMQKQTGGFLFFLAKFWGQMTSVIKAKSLGRWGRELSKSSGLVERQRVGEGLILKCKVLGGREGAMEGVGGGLTYKEKFMGEESSDFCSSTAGKGVAQAKQTQASCRMPR